MTQLSSRPWQRSVRSLPTPIAFLLFAAFIALFTLALVPTRAQTNSRVTSVDPTSAKVNDSVTVAGDGLAKTAVSGVFLSDDKNDYKATVVEQQAQKIVFKVPEVKAGPYNISIQVGNSLLIQPVRITIE
jgi:hypothetical protein